jgi:hypothetical protein
VIEPPPRIRAKAPRAARPAPPQGKGEVLRGFLDSQDALRSLLSQSADLDVNAIRFRNPFVGGLPFRVGTAFLIAAAHDRRHLWQARQLTTSPGFPRR